VEITHAATIVQTIVVNNQASEKHVPTELKSQANANKIKTTPTPPTKSVARESICVLQAYFQAQQSDATDLFLDQLDSMLDVIDDPVQIIQTQLTNYTAPTP
jgi:hypothetical protein